MERECVIMKTNSNKQIDNFTTNNNKINNDNNISKIT